MTRPVTLLARLRAGIERSTDPAAWRAGAEAVLLELEPVLSEARFHDGTLRRYLVELHDAEQARRDALAPVEAAPLPPEPAAPVLPAAPPMPADWDEAPLTAIEAAEYLRVSACAVRSWIRHGLVEVWDTPGGQPRIRRSALLKRREFVPGDVSTG